MPESFQERLNQGLILGDGALGTELYQRTKIITGRSPEFLHNEVPGMALPEAARDALRVAGNDAAEVGLEQSRRLLADVHEMVSGAYIIPPFGRYSIALELLDGVKNALGLGVHVETETE